MHFSTIISTLLLLLAVSCTTPPQKTVYPVRVSSRIPMEEVTPEEIERLYDERVVDSYDNAEYDTVWMATDFYDTEKVAATTPREYLKYAAQGKYCLPPSVSGRHIRLRAATLDLLKNHAKPSHTSYLQDFTFDDPDILNKLPASLPNFWHEYADGFSDYPDNCPAQTPSLLSVFPNAIIKKQSATEIWIFIENPKPLFPDQGWFIALEISAWGDFNNDGIEDLLVDQVQRLPPGSYSQAWPIIFSLTEPDGILQEIKASNGEPGEHIGGRVEKRNVGK